MPTQATNTTSGNYRARLYGEFYDPTGRQWRVELIDNETSTGHTDFSLANSTSVYEVELAEDGFSLNWDGPTDTLGAAVIPSSCEFTFVVDTNALETVKTVIRDNNDGRLGVAVYYDDGGTHWKPWWVGPLNHEAIEYELQDRPYLFTIRASCGLNRLRNIEFTNDGDAYQGKKTLAGIIARCLNKIPTANFWNGSEDQLKEVVDIFNDQHADADFTETEGAEFPTTVLEQTLTRAEAFYTTNLDREDDFGRRAHYPENFNSCFDVLEHITNAFGARMYQNAFAWWFFPPNALNWSTSLKVQKWTRTQVSSESLGRVLSGSNYVPKASSESVTFKQDLETNHALGEGWTNSYLLPVKRCSITHLKAGRQSVFGNPRFFYFDYPSAGGPTFVNSDLELSEGQTLNLTGLYDTGNLVREYGSVITNAAFNDHGVNRIGARVILRLKVKVGNQYYGSEFSMDSQTTDIDMPTGYNGDFNDPDLQFKEVNLPNPSWSTNEKWFDVVVPWTNSNPEPAIQSDGNGWNRVGGFHIKATDDNQFEYRVNGTQDRRFEQPFDITTAPLPNDSSSYTGVEVTVERVVITRTGTVLQTFDDLEDIFFSVAAVQYDHNGNDIAPSFKNAPEDFVSQFRVGVDSDDEDGDTLYFVEQDENTEYLDLGDTLVGVSETEGGLPNAAGALYTFTSSTTQNTALTGDTWHSITDTVDQEEDGSHNLVVVAREALYMRGKPLPVQRGEVVPKYGTSNTTAPLDMTTAWAHNCSTVGDVEDVLVPLSLGFTAGTGVYSFEGALLSRTRLSFDPYVDPLRPSKGDGGGPIGPVNQGKASTSNQFTDLLDQVGGVEEAVDDIATKTDLITVTGAVNLDTVNTKVGHLTVTQAVDLDTLESTTSDHATNIREVQDVTDLISINQGATEITGFSLADNAVRADKIQQNATHRFITDSKLAEIASNTLGVAANGGDINTNAGAITSIEAKTDLLTVTNATNVDTVRNKTDAITINPSRQITALTVTGTPLDADNISQNGTNKFTTAANNTKLGYITVTQAVNLDDLEQDVDDIAVAIDLDNNGDAARTHAGAEIALWNNNGVLESVVDGSAGQYLKTDGLGRYSWGTPSGGGSPYTLVTTSGRAPLYYARFFYYGSSSYGWDFYNPSSRNNSSTSFSSMNDQYAHAGIVLPTSCSELKLFSTIRNDSRADDVEIYVHAGSRPNGTSTNITLTKLDKATASCSSGQDLHYNADFTKTGLSLSAGDLLFVSFRRLGTTNATTYVNYSYTIHITP